MSVTTEAAGSIFQIPPFPVRRFTVDEYHRMIQTGVLAEDDPVELLEGWIVPKMPRNPCHDAIIELAHEALAKRLPEGWRVRVQSAITTGDSEPEPDLVVVRGLARSYVSRHPGAQDLAVVVEVADTSLTYDRRDKGRSYARAGIPIYWIVNLEEAKVEVYTDPFELDTGSAYRQRHDYAAGEFVPFIIEGQEIERIPVQELMP